ncbi:MAG: hypothetical protein HKM98_10060, partial [Gammaproteobacteria bacterium]|nr:hypothetical protein [Gammaproteobacteria bacterium]
GSAQALDHTASSSALQPYFREAAFARGNADAPSNLLLATGADLGLRIADHDALVTYYMTDADADGLADDQDNCINVENPDQTDADGDNIGNICDADIAVPNDCLINFADLNVVATAFFGNPGSANWNPAADFDNSGLVNFADLNVIAAMFFQPPGPSAAGCN